MMFVTLSTSCAASQSSSAPLPSFSVEPCEGLDLVRHNLTRGTPDRSPVSIVASDSPADRAQALLAAAILGSAHGYAASVAFSDDDDRSLFVEARWRAGVRMHVWTEHIGPDVPPDVMGLSKSSWGVYVSSAMAGAMRNLSWDALEDAFETLANHSLPDPRTNRTCSSDTPVIVAAIDNGLCDFAQDLSLLCCRWRFRSARELQWTIRSWNAAGLAFAVLEITINGPWDGAVRGNAHLCRADRRSPCVTHLPFRALALHPSTHTPSAAGVADADPTDGQSC